VNQTAAVRRTRETFQSLELNGSWPRIRFDLDDQNPGAVEADNIPRAQGGGGAGAAIPGGLEEGHCAVFVPGAFSLRFHGASTLSTPLIPS